MSDDMVKPYIRSDVQYRELEDGGVVYDTIAERIHTLNVTAAYIWNCCDGSHTLPDIARLLEEVNGSPETALRDVEHAVTYFHSEGLLRTK